MKKIKIKKNAAAGDGRVLDVMANACEGRVSGASLTERSRRFLRKAAGWDETLWGRVVSSMLCCSTRVRLISTWLNRLSHEFRYAAYIGNFHYYPRNRHILNTPYDHASFVPIPLTCLAEV
jgi:hypothetical protein